MKLQTQARRFAKSAARQILDFMLKPSSVADRRRYVTILFSDLCDSVGLAESMGDVRYAEVLRDLRDVSRTVVARHGGRVARIQGDGMLAFFGFSTHTIEDARRAVACALELHEEVGAVALNRIGRDGSLLAMHTGIHSGLTCVETGDVERGRFDLVGSAPNLAARLCGLAGRNQIFDRTDGRPPIGCTLCGGP